MRLLKKILCYVFLYFLISDFYVPTPQEIFYRDNICKSLSNYLQFNYNSSTCMNLFGSSRNGFGFRGSDLDICMTFDGDPTAEVSFKVYLKNKLPKTECTWSYGISNQSSLYSRCYAETCNEWRAFSAAWRMATQLRRNIAAVASRWLHCVDLTGVGMESRDLPHWLRCYTTRTGKFLRHNYNRLQKEPCERP